jgi:hypothetical protein
MTSMTNQTRLRKPALGLVLLTVLVLITTSVMRAQTLGAGAKDKSCRQHPQLVGACFNVHGRLSVYNGAPALRIWKIGTKSMLGVSQQRFALSGYRNLPDEIQNQIKEDVDLWGDFLGCPFTRAKAGEMQMVCVEAGRNLKAKKRNP